MLNNRKDQISYALLSVAMKIQGVNNRARNYGTQVALHEAEIHVIKMIQECEGISVTGLAEKLNVTKGAVSQILSRLDKKGMILKTTDPTNLSRLQMALTPQGLKAYQNHALLHEKFDDCVKATLSGASENEREFLLHFLQEIDEKVEKMDL